MNDFQHFKNASSYKLSPEIISIKKEIDILSMLYMIVGVHVQEYPENYPFEISSRLLNIYGIKPQITHLIKQLDEQSVRYCSLIVPYCQLQPPGSGLIYSMNQHTAAVIDMDFTDDQMVLISLSDRIVVTDMQETKTVLDINLPTIDEPYLNSTTLFEALNIYGNEEVKTNSSSNDEKDQYKKFLFLVNSRHHIYLVSALENIKFQRSSKSGYLAVEVLHQKRALCIISELNENSVECWNVLSNRLFDRVNLPPQSIIKHVLCVETYSMIVIVLQDGTMQFHSITDWTKFVHRGDIRVGPHLDLVVLDGEMLIITFDAAITVDFAVMGLKQFHDSEQVLSDGQIVKTLIAFDPPIGPKPIKSIILPDHEGASKAERQSNFPLFMAKTNDCLDVVHKCNKKDISYVRIPGRFDFVSTHTKNPRTIYTARGGIVELHKWSCCQDDEQKYGHTYQLYISIDISASPVTSIKASSENGKYIVFANEHVNLIVSF